MRFYKMDHRGGLDESLNTRSFITKEEFNELLPFYTYYCYDERIKCHRFILRDMNDNLKGYYTWLLFSEIVDNEPDKLFGNMVRIYSEIDFFNRFVKYGILDSTNSYIQSLMTLSTKLEVLLYKKNFEYSDFIKFLDLYDRFNLVIFNLYQSLRKE